MFASTSGGGSVGVTSIKHDKSSSVPIKASPNTQTFVRRDLANKHPLEVSSNSVLYSLVKTHTTISIERGLGVIQL